MPRTSTGSGRRQQRALAWRPGLEAALWAVRRARTGSEDCSTSTSRRPRGQQQRVSWRVRDAFAAHFAEFMTEQRHKQKPRERASKGRQARTRNRGCSGTAAWLCWPTMAVSPRFARPRSRGAWRDGPASKTGGADTARAARPRRCGRRSGRRREGGHQRIPRDRYHQDTKRQPTTLGSSPATRVHDRRADMPEVQWSHEDPGRDYRARCDTSDSGPPRNCQRSPSLHRRAPPAADRAFGGARPCRGRLR